MHTNAPVTADGKRLLEQLQVLGGSAGNGKLRARLGWDEARYEATRGVLLLRGLLVKRQGRGGAVALAAGHEAASEAAAAVEPASAAAEQAEAGGPKARPTPAPGNVEAYTHDAARRVVIPTAENQALVPDDDRAVRALRYPRNPDLDPQLVWRGKDREDGGPLEVPSPPIYVQEKIHPRSLIEALKRDTARRRGQRPGAQVDFFHDFNGVELEARTEFYSHSANWQNRMILGDSLQVMASLAERENLRGRVQCIYLDPPYGIRFNSNWQPSTRGRDVKDGKAESVSREPEVVRAFRDTWRDGVHSYLSYLRDRLTVANDLLHESGSIFVQIGDENVHRVRAVMDEVFGDSNFIAQIQVKKSGGATSRHLPGVTDFIIWYAKHADVLKLRPLFVAGDDDSRANDYRLLETDVDVWQPATGDDLKQGVNNERGRLLQLITLTSQRQGRDTSADSAMGFSFQFRGESFPPSSGRGWSTTEGGMNRLVKANRITKSGKNIRLKRYLQDSPSQPLTDFWDDLLAGAGKEKTYVVQTASRVVARCLLITTDPGDLVLDPTCGSGTTATVAEAWGRRWITVDTSRVALTLARARLMGARYDYHLLRDSPEGAAKEAELTGRLPAPGPFAGDLRQGFVLERVPRVTLKSIANNAEIDGIWERWQARLEPIRAALNAALGQAWEEWQVPREAEPAWAEAARADHAAWWEARRARQAEIDASIARNAEVEPLHDRPYKARGVTRVAGPFTVESLSPHRVLPLEEDPYLAELLGEGGEAPAGARLPDRRNAPARPGPERASPEPTDFAKVVYDNLLAAGVQNTKRGEAIRFEWLRPRASRSGLVPFEGLYLEGEEPRRAAICIGPEYDAVGFDLVRQAVREAALYDVLIVCGFAFAPEVDDTRLAFPLPVLKARMNQDLRMGDRLKATGAGNLFVVFGEPDIAVEPAGEGLIRVEIRGMDIFDPTTGQVRSSGGDDLKADVAAWFVDDDYDEESFFVRQAYFVGDDPYEGLRRALKAEIDEAAWAEINATVSRPFPRPERGRICVKVINHFGDEVQKVFTV